VAVSDPLGLTAQPLKVVDRKPHSLFLASIRDLMVLYETGELVLGLPRRTDGRIGPEAQRILALAHELRNKLEADVVTWEEWLTTAEAERLLKSDGLNSRQRRQVVDKTAAALILQGYLDRRSPKTVLDNSTVSHE
jgi:putative Holliday junction resolvase